VTGGGRGIGAATARLAAQRGYAVCINYLQDRATAEEVVRAIPKAIAVQADIGVEDDVVRLFETVDRELGPLTALVNKCGRPHAPDVCDQYHWYDAVLARGGSANVASRRAA
jgi:NAD(P)-dependent dehydrogenase (short-subunit alcohol dehydrogenase family)